MRRFPVFLPAFFSVFLVFSCSVWAAEPSGAPAASLSSADSLAGLWKAKRRFGPDVRGTISIMREAGDYLADIGGKVLPVHAEGGEIALSLPDAQGSFRGKFEGRNKIVGHWFQPPGRAAFAGGVYVSPVVLLQTKPNHWVGGIAPLDDDFTLYLLIQKAADGSLAVVMRNPERDIGTQLGAERLSVEGAAIKVMGKRRGQTEERVIAQGEIDPETHNFRLVLAERGGAYDFERAGDDSDFYPRGKAPPKYVYHAPPALDDGWAASTLKSENIDEPAMMRFVQAMAESPMDSTGARQLHGVLIARNGKIVLEEYFHGQTREGLHETRSAAKSITSIIAGAAMKAGIPLTLSSPVYEVMNGGRFPEGLDSQKKTMTLENLLTMSSGFFCDDSNPDAPGNEDNMNDQTAEPNYYRFFLKLPQATPPGEKAVYCSGGANLALGMVGAAAKENPLYLFDRLVAEPLKIARYAWPLDPAGNPYGGGSAQFTLRDFAKFGQLLLNGGQWHGKRILSADFVRRATSPHYHLVNIYYGYLWWCNSVPYKKRMVRIFSALGAGGQSVTVVPELNLVVAMNAANYSDRIAIDTSHNLLPNYILPAVREHGDDPNAPVAVLDYKTPYHMSPDGSRVQ